MEHIHTQTGTRFTYETTATTYRVAAYDRAGDHIGGIVVPLDQEAPRWGYLFEQETINSERVRQGL